MNISKREKIMVMILFIFISIFLFSNFFLKPRKEKLQSLKEENIQLEQRVKMVEQQGSRKKKNIASIAELRKEINTLSLDTFDFIGEEDVIGIMEEIIVNADIHINNMSITPKSNESLSSNSSETTDITEKSSIGQAYDQVLAFKKEDIVIKEGKVENDNTKDNNISIAKTGVTLSYKGDFNQLMKFISEIESYRKKIVIKSINMGSSEMFEFTGNIALELYNLPILNKEMYMEFYPTGDKNNPFASNEENSNASVSNKENNNLSGVITTKADVSMMLKPTSSDLPTMYINLTDKKNKSEVIEDSGSYENGGIYIKGTEGQYFIKYAIGKRNFPEKGYQRFIPNSDDMIKIEVSSTYRNSDKDSNGVNMTIVNESSLIVKVNVIGDDSKRPRLIMTKVVGQVKIE